MNPSDRPTMISAKPHNEPFVVSHPTRPGRLLLMILGLVTTFVSMLTMTRPAAAHSGKGTIKVVRADVIGPLSMHYEVSITFTSDGHPAPDAEVTVVEANGLSVGPVPLTAVSGADGTYETTVIFPGPGVWQARFSSLEPTAVLERTETVSPPTLSTTTAPSTTAALSTTPAPSTTTAPASTVSTTSAPDPVETTSPVTAERSGDPQPAPRNTSPGKRGGPGALIIGVGIVATLVLAGATLVRRRWRQGSQS